MSTQKKKRKVKKWVWVVGWLLCFPIPLTVLISRSKRLNKIAKVILISLLWVFVLVWTATLSSSSEPESPMVADTLPSQDDFVIEEVDYKAKFIEEMNDTGILFTENVYQDSTGRLRECLIYSDEDFIEHAADYYHGYFESDDEIHAVINLYLKTSTRVTVSGVNLMAVVYEYVDGEEHRASDLFCGMHYATYIINKVTGEYEKLVTDYDYTVVDTDDSIEEASRNLLDNKAYTDYIVLYDGNTLTIEFQEMPPNYPNIADEEVAYLAAVTFTDDFLEQYKKDEDWNMIIIRFDGLGEFRLTKDMIMDGGAYGRFFNFRQDDLILE